jgi:hypothetical protein
MTAQQVQMLRLEELINALAGYVNATCGNPTPLQKERRDKLEIALINIQAQFPSLDW